MPRKLRFRVRDAAADAVVFRTDSIDVLASYAYDARDDDRDLHVERDVRGAWVPLSAHQHRQLRRGIAASFESNKEVSPTHDTTTKDTRIERDDAPVIAHRTSVAEAVALAEWARDNAVPVSNHTKEITTMATATKKSASKTTARKGNAKSNTSLKEATMKSQNTKGQNSKAVADYAAHMKKAGGADKVKTLLSKGDTKTVTLLANAVKAYPGMKLTRAEENALQKQRGSNGSTPTRSRNGSTPRPKHDDRIVALAREATELQNNPIGGGEKGWAPVNPGTISAVEAALKKGRKAYPEQIGMTGKVLKEYATTGDRSVVTAEMREAMGAFIAKHLDPLAKTGKSKVRGVRLAVCVYVLARDKGEAPGYSRSTAKAAAKRSNTRRTATKRPAKKAARTTRTSRRK